MICLYLNYKSSEWSLCWFAATRCQWRRNRPEPQTSTYTSQLIIRDTWLVLCGEMWKYLWFMCFNQTKATCELNVLVKNTITLVIQLFHKTKTESKGDKSCTAGFLNSTQAAYLHSDLLLSTTDWYCPVNKLNVLLLSAFIIFNNIKWRNWWNLTFIPVHFMNTLTLCRGSSETRKFFKYDVLHS